MRNEDLYIKMVDIAPRWAEETGSHVLAVAGTLGRLLAGKKASPSAVVAFDSIGCKLPDVKIDIGDVARYFTHGESLLGQWGSAVRAEAVHIHVPWLSLVLRDAKATPPSFLVYAGPEDKTERDNQLRERMHKGEKVAYLSDETGLSKKTLYNIKNDNPSGKAKKTSIRSGVKSLLK